MGSAVKRERKQTWQVGVRNIKKTEDILKQILTFKNVRNIVKGKSRLCSHIYVFFSINI